MQVRVVSSIPLCTGTTIVISCQVNYINRSQQKSLNLSFVQHLKSPTIGCYCYCSTSQKSNYRLLLLNFALHFILEFSFSIEGIFHFHNPPLPSFSGKLPSWTPPLVHRCLWELDRAAAVRRITLPNTHLVET